MNEERTLNEPSSIQARAHEGEQIYASIMYDRGHEKCVDDWARMPSSTVLGADLYCLEIRQFTEIQTFAGIRADDDVDSILARLVADNILFQAAAKFLSLVVADDSGVAVRRIRSASEARQDNASASKHRLMVVG